MEATLKKAVAAAGVDGWVVVLGPVRHVLPFVRGDGPFEDHRSSLPPDPRREEAGISALSRALTSRGVLAFPRPLRGYVRGYLSLAHREEDIERTGERVYEALRQSSSHFA